MNEDPLADKAAHINIGDNFASASGSAGPARSDDAAPRMSYADLERLGDIPKDLQTTNPELHEHLSNGGVSDLIANKMTSFPQLEHLHRMNPETLTALRHKNFVDAVNAGRISVAQIGRIAPDALKAMESIVNGDALVAEVERYAGPDAEKPVPGAQPTPSHRSPVLSPIPSPS